MMGQQNFSGTNKYPGLFLLAIWLSDDPQHYGFSGVRKVRVSQEIDSLRSEGVSVDFVHQLLCHIHFHTIRGM
jgi:hypothetical protein